MIIPLKIALPLLVVIPLAIWFAGISKYDFLTPREIPANELRPKFASPVNRDIIDSLRVNSEPEPPLPPPLPEILPGDLAVSPALDAYLKDAPTGAPSLLQLATTLENRGQIQRAFLAYERIIDSTPAQTSFYEHAEGVISSLKTNLPVWNPDPSAAIPISVHIATARPAESFSSSLTILSELIAISSGGICLPHFEVAVSPQPLTPLPSLPAAVWFNIAGEDEKNPSLSVVTIAPKTDSEFEDKLLRAVYQLVSRRLEAIDQLNPLPPLNPEDSAQEALVNRVTRLAWREVAGTPFHSLEAQSPITPETSTPSQDQE